MKLCAYLTASVIWLAGFFTGMSHGYYRGKEIQKSVRDKAMPSSLEYRGPEPESERLSFTF